MTRSYPKHQGKSKFVPTCNHCGVVGHIRPNCLQLRSQSEVKARMTSRNQTRPNSTHVCHHCGVFGHTCPKYFKLHTKKRLSNLSKIHDLIPLVEELLKALSFLTQFQGNVIASLSFHRFARTHASSSSQLKTCVVWVRKNPKTYFKGMLFPPHPFIDSLGLVLLHLHIQRLNCLSVCLLLEFFSIIFRTPLFQIPFCASCISYMLGITCTLVHAIFILLLFFFLIHLLFFCLLIFLKKIGK